jgi:septum formation protein
MNETSSQSPVVYLASSSPRRRELLQQVGVQYELLPIDVEESRLPGETPEQYVGRVALDKALAGWDCQQRTLDIPVLGSDTEVVLDGEIFGKPKSRQHGLDMLRMLSGKSHRVLCAVALVQGGRKQVRLNVNTVTFRELSAEEVEAYWDTGEPEGKAGGYAIQGKAAAFISRLDGSFSGVMGLSLYDTVELLENFGVDVINPHNS